MKRLMISILLVLGATTYGVAKGGYKSAKMPVIIKGIVIPTPGNELVIEPKNMAGADGASLEFDFGEITQGGTRIAQGTYEIYRTNGSQIYPGGLITNTIIGFLDENGDVTDTQLKSRTIGDSSVQSAIRLTLENGGVQRFPGNKISGRITATVKAEAAADGEFLYADEKIGILIE